ncbi:integrase, catalytic region, zinc finger, CCHC-type containing protein [Tanacetum coccineum]
MLEMMVELQEVRTTLKKSLVRVVMFRKRLGMYRELLELLHQEMLQMFSATIIVLKEDEAGVILSNKYNDFLLVDVAQMEESANICMMARIQQATIDSDEGPSYDSAFISEDLNDETESVKKESINVQECFHKRIKILEYDVQRCQKQSLDFELQLQHEKEKTKCESSLKNLCETSWISKMDKLENENTQTQSHKEINKLIESVNQKTYAYEDVKAHNQDLLITISELKAKLKPAEKGLKGVTSVRRPPSRRSSKNSVLSNTKNQSKVIEGHVRTNKKTHVTSKKNVIQTKKIVTNIDVKNSLKVKDDALFISYDKNVLIPCHDIYTTLVVVKTRFAVVTPLSAKNKASSASRSTSLLAQENSLSKYMRTIINTSRKWKKFFEKQPNIGWTPKSITVKACPSVVKSRDSTVIQIILWIVDSGCSKHMTGNLKLLKIFVRKFMGIVCFRNDHFVAITGYGNYVHSNVTICHVYYVEGLRHSLFSVGQFCDSDLEVAFRSKTCFVRNLEGDALLTGAREVNMYMISISDMAASSPVFLMSKATSTKSWLWHQRLSHLNFGTINNLTKQDLVDGLLKFKYKKDRLCSACKQGKSKIATLQPKLIPSTHSKLEVIHMDLCGPMQVESINGKKYIMIIVNDYSGYTWV